MSHSKWDVGQDVAPALRAFRTQRVKKIPLWGRVAGSVIAGLITLLLGVFGYLVLTVLGAALIGR